MQHIHTLTTEAWCFTLLHAAYSYVNKRHDASRYFTQHIHTLTTEAWCFTLLHAVYSYVNKRHDASRYFTQHGAILQQLTITVLNVAAITRMYSNGNQEKLQCLLEMQFMSDQAQLQPIQLFLLAETFCDFSGKTLLFTCRSSDSGKLYYHVLAAKRPPLVKCPPP